MSKLTREQIQEEARTSGHQRLRGENFRSANLSELDLQDSDLGDSDLSESFLGRTNLTETNLEHVSLEGASLANASMGQVHLAGARLSRASLQDVNLEGGDLRRIELREANLAGARLARAILSQADLRQARLTGSDLTEATLDEASLVQVNLQSAMLRGAHLRSADFRSAVLREADLTEADLSNASFDQADLEGASLKGALLVGTDLRGADLSTANLFQADLRGARYDRRTRWPDGFSPGDAGAILTHTGEPAIELTSIRPGKSHPLGATWDGQGVNWALYSPNASRVELCLFDSADAMHESARVTMLEQTDEVWHVYVPHLGPGQLYGYRVHGISYTGKPDLLEEDGVGLAQHLGLVARHVAQDAHGEAGAGKRMAAQQVVGQAQLAAERADLVLEQLAQRWSTRPAISSTFRPMCRTNRST